MARRDGVCTLHHLAGTGGTLFSKCLAAMDGVVFLSEVHPFAFQLGHNPFDPIQQFQARQPAELRFPDGAMARIFHERIALIHARCAQHSRTLVLRDWSHADYMAGRLRRDRPLLSLIRGTYDVRSALTIRNPVESYLSSAENRWLGAVAGFDAYCRRVRFFLDDYRDLPVFTYEGLLAAPEETMAGLCGALDLPFDPAFPARIPGIALTGDSGRGQEPGGIRRRPMRLCPEGLRQEALASWAFQELCDRFGWDRDPLVTAARIEAERGEGTPQQIVRYVVN